MTQVSTHWLPTHENLLSMFVATTKDQDQTRGTAAALSPSLCPQCFVLADYNFVW